MQATLTNLGPVPVPLSSTQDKGFVTSLDPGVAHELDSEAVTVVTVGDNPSFREDLGEALAGVVELFKKLVTFWRQHHENGSVQPNAQVHPIVTLQIVAGTSTVGIRVLQGDNRELDHNMAPGETFVATAPDYIELRELGV